MSDEFAVRLSGAGKMYKLFGSRTDNLLDAVGLGRLPGRRVDYREFWALRGVNLELGVGARLGVIGRNGAGKTTLLKLITGTLQPSEGEVRVRGAVQALLEAGAGFHPDFTGYENIRAALTYQGLSGAEIAEAESDIAAFTELGEFLTQPFKTYSTGMQARLAFATATTVRPEILIVDEILGAGDAYFISKSNERMRQLVGSGASILLVSHSMLQITQLCETAVWLDRGEVVAIGDSIQVVKEYESFIRELDDRRLRAKNVKRRQVPRISPIELESPQVDLRVTFALEGPRSSRFDLRAVRFLTHGAEVDAVRVGSTQDGSVEHSAHVLLDGDWSPPLDGPDGSHRHLARSDSSSPKGAVSFEVLIAEDSPAWELDIEYRLTEGASVAVAAAMGGKGQEDAAVLAPAAAWRSERIALSTPTHVRTTRAADQQENGSQAEVQAVPQQLKHWPGEGSLQITRIDLVDGSGTARAVFEVGSQLTMRIEYEVITAGLLDLLPVVNIYALDGTNISTLVGAWIRREYVEGIRHQVEVTLNPLNLGNGNYLISVAMYKSFDPDLTEEPIAYDWVDRSVEFEVMGNPPALTSVFLHPSDWDAD